jgi:hypothetical protein
MQTTFLEIDNMYGKFLKTSFKLWSESLFSGFIIFGSQPQAP